MLIAAAFVAVGTLLYGTLVGYLTHWVLHQAWAGRVHRSHLNHHIRQYPPKSLVSDTYRDSGRDDSLFVFIPAITLALVPWFVVLWSVGAPWWALALVFAEGTFVGWLHNYIHEGFHLETFWLVRFSWFRTVRASHWLHHWNMRRNLGIMWFGWDRLFKTYRTARK